MDFGDRRKIFRAKQKARCAKRMEIRKAVEQRLAESGGAGNQVENEFPAIPSVPGMDEVETAIGFLLQGSDLVDDFNVAAFSEEAPEDEAVCRAVS